MTTKIIIIFYILMLQLVLVGRAYTWLYSGISGGLSVGKLHFGYDGNNPNEKDTIDNYNKSYDYDKGYCVGLLGLIKYPYFPVAAKIEVMWVTKNSLGIKTQTKNKYFTSWMEVPLIIYYYPINYKGVKPLIGAGFYNAFLQSATKKLPNDDKKDITTINFDPQFDNYSSSGYKLNKYECGFVFSLGTAYEISKLNIELSIEVRYERGLNNFTSVKEYTMKTDAFLILCSCYYEIL